MPPGSITSWLQALQGGDRDAAQLLWERFSHRLLGLARKKLDAVSRTVSDEEDLALSAFNSFCQQAEHGQFARLVDRGDLWQLLVLITNRKAIDYCRYECRQKRCSPVAEPLALADAAEVELVSREPGPELATIMVEECARLMGLLEDPELQTVALMKMEGYTDEEIAQQLTCTRRTVQRRLRLIREIWRQEAA